jgi:hypothetical protein
MASQPAPASVGTDEETLKFTAIRGLAGQRVLCVTRPRHPPFLWQRFEIKSPELWTIFNVAIGNRSLFKQNPGEGTGISAQQLNEDGLLCKDVCRAAQDFSIEALYIGPDPESAEFDCAVIGRVPR